MASGDMLSSDRITTSNDKHDEVFYPYKGMETG